MKCINMVFLQLQTEPEFTRRIMKDRVYWLTPRSRRFLDETQSTDAIGFRCAMDRLGSQTSKSKNNQRKKVDYNKKRRQQ